jgi:PAS domain S-box-containing protein
MADLLTGTDHISQAAILHIEDDPANRYATGRILQREGFTVREAATGVEGLRLLREEPDLVILDVRLPDLSGFEVCRRIKADPATATIPVLHLSASYVTDEDQVTGLEGGADAYLVQPVDPDVLVATAKALLRLRRAEEKYRSIFENAVEGIFQTSIEGRLLTANPMFARMFGYSSPDEMIAAVSDVGYHLYNDPAQRKEIVRLLQEQGTLAGFEVLGRCRDGSKIWISLSARIIRDYDGRTVGFEGTVEDITERKRAEKEIENRAHQQAAVAELGHRALAETDVQFVMEEADTLIAQTLGVEYCNVLELLPTGEELLLRAGIGWKEGLVAHATVDAGAGSQAGYTLLSREPVVVKNLSTEERFKGSPLLREHGVVSSMSVVISGRDRPFGVLGAYTKEQREFTGDDVNFFEAVANVLAAAVQRNEVEKKLREVREVERQRMARDLHDEALQSLTWALAETQLLQRTFEDPMLEHRLEGMVEALKRTGQGMRSAIYDLRLEGGNEGQTLVEMLESLVELNRRRFPEREIELSVEEGFSPPLSSIKQVELLRLLREALTNAERHSGAHRIRISVGVSGRKLWAEVSDDGRGFDSTKTTAGGMGLHGMRERAHALGGALKISSKAGEGTKVCFEMTLQKGHESLEEAVRILLVEDHASFRQAIASMFEREPEFVVVGQAGTLSEAREMLYGVDVAVVDLTLPDGYGGELIKELRAYNPQAQVLVLSASLDRAEIARAVEAGAAGILHKTVEMYEVVKAVQRLRAGETLLPMEDVVELLRFASSQRDQEYKANQVIAQLTTREKEVLQVLAEGLDSKEIAERLHISSKTEANHMSSILNKLGLHSRLQALVFALRYGVVEIH